MALIPPDAGVRLKLQTEASLLQPLAGVRPVPSDLPDLQPGQTFMARIYEPLPDNTYRALVAGRMLTLQLPEGASAGDSLELVVIDRTPKLVIAQRVDNSAAGNLESHGGATLSRAAQLIAQLLPAGGEAPPTAPLSRGQPLLPMPPSTGASLAPVLARAVGESGLFYEAHQAQWLAGQRPLDSLRSEPQGRLPAATTTGPSETGARSRPTLPGAPVDAGSGEQALFARHGTPEPLQANAQAEMAASVRVRGENREQAAVSTTGPVPESIRPLVQQQLDAAATQRLAWHGEVWPGQQIDWRVEREQIGDSGAGAESEPAPKWSTRLRLTLPRLGSVDAELNLSGRGLHVRLATGDTGAGGELQAAVPQLAESLRAAGVNPETIYVVPGPPANGTG